MTHHIQTERQEHVLIITINRPEKLNAFTNEMYQKLGNAFMAASEDASVRCILLKATGDRAFCVGSDIDEFQATLGQQERQIADTRIGRATMDIVATCPHPIVVAIKGVCVGGGLEIATISDIRVASNSVKFGIPIKNLNMHVEIEDLEHLHRVLGGDLSLDLLLTGRMMEAEEAKNNGFAQHIYPTDQVDNEAFNIAAKIAEGAPLAARWHKRALRRLSKPSSDIAHLAQDALDCYAHDDFAEGCAAFSEKRKPVFKGN